MLAVAEFHTRSFTSQSDELMALLATFGDQLASFIERSRAESRLEAGEGFKAAMLAASMDCIIGMDDNGIVLEFNEPAESLFGYRRADALGRELAELIVPPDLRDRHRDGLRRYLETGEGRVIDRRVELPAMRSDGSLISVELTVTRIEATDPPIFTGFVRDLSDRAEAERVRQHLAEVVAAPRTRSSPRTCSGSSPPGTRRRERLYGYSAEEAIGRHISFIVPQRPQKRGDGDPRTGPPRRTARNVRDRADPRRRDPDRRLADRLADHHPSAGLVGASVIARDITAEKRRRRAQEFLVAASRLLDTSLDIEQTARTIVATAVPELAEICVIDFLREDGSYGDSVVAGADPAAAARLEEIRRGLAARPRRGAPGRAGDARGAADDLARPEGARRDRRGRPERRAPALDRGGRLQLGGGRAADRPRPHARRRSPSSRQPRPALRPRAISTSSASSATAPRWRSTTPASTASATRISESLQRGLRPPLPGAGPGAGI